MARRKDESLLSILIRKPWYWSVVFLLALPVVAGEYVQVRPDRVVTINEDSYILPWHLGMTLNPYDQRMYVGIPGGFISYDLDGKIGTPYKTNSTQEPGGLSGPTGFFFYPDFFYLPDRMKIVKLDYSRKLLNEMRGLLYGDFVFEDGSFLYFNHMNCLELRDAKGKVLGENKDVTYTPEHKSSAVNAYIKCSLFPDENYIWAAPAHHYQLFKLNRATLETMDRFGEKPEIFREPDDTKPGAYGMQLVDRDLAKKLLQGSCAIFMIRPWQEWVFVYWVVAFQPDGYVDIYEKKSLKRVKQLKLEDFEYQPNTAMTFDPQSGRLFQVDNVVVDGDETTILKIYELSQYIK